MKNSSPAHAADRQYWCDLLYRIAEPVLASLARGELKKNMAVEVGPNWEAGRNRNLAYLECVGRLMAGLAPWLALPDDETAEGRQRRRLRDWALEGIARAVDPAGPDYFNWRTGNQPLVDSAYFAEALLRAPVSLWSPLDGETRRRIVEELSRLRRVMPPFTNWLLFAAMNETFLMSVGAPIDPVRIDLVIRNVDSWYVGDGWYADGEAFHFDYYNSFVIHPMVVEILESLAVRKTVLTLGPAAELHARALQRCRRHAFQLERLISPEGTFPPIGRSLTYRTAAFQPLALTALRKVLPENLSEGQTRAALTAVHKAIFANPGNFDEGGFLTLGFAGHQPELADWYSNNGSMYITTASFLPLGLPATDSFWTSEAEDWTAKKAFANRKFVKDYPVDF
jgi:hypothetical protein